MLSGNQEFNSTPECTPSVVDITIKLVIVDLELECLLRCC